MKIMIHSVNSTQVTNRRYLKSESEILDQREDFQSRTTSTNWRIQWIVENRNTSVNADYWRFVVIGIAGAENDHQFVLLVETTADLGVAQWEREIHR